MDLAARRVMVYAATITRLGYCRPEPLLHGNRSARLTLLSYQAAKARRICCAAAKCSNQTDLHLTFIDPIRPSGLRQRPSVTAMPLATDQKVGGSSPSACRVVAWTCLRSCSRA